MKQSNYNKLNSKLPNKKDIFYILINYEDIINQIISITKQYHHELLEDLAENIFDIIFENKIVKKVTIELEKLDIIKNTESVGIEVSKKRDE